MKQARLIVMLFVGVMTAYVLHETGVLQRSERSLEAARMSLSPRNASGEIVLVAIDGRSIDAIGTWPWPREVYAKTLERVIELGATEVFFDIDLSSPSTLASDEKFAEALAAARGKVILPAFTRSSMLGSTTRIARESFPLPRFRDLSWVASVNVRPDSDGRVRQYYWGHYKGGVPISSAGAVLAGEFGPPGTSFTMNFGIRPESIPIVSLTDVIDGTIGQGAFEGKSVVVGSQAVELRDHFTVPVHGVIPGPLLHILAAETLKANIALTSLSITAPFLLVAAIAIAIAISSIGRRPLALAGVLAGVAVILEVIAFVLHKRFSVVLPTALLHLTLLSIIIVVMGCELNLRRWLINGFRREARNSRNVMQQVVTDSADAILIVDEGGAILDANERAHDLFSLEGGFHQGIGFNEVLPDKLAAATHGAMADLRAGHIIPRRTLRIVWCKDREVHLECTVTPSRRERADNLDYDDDGGAIACITVRDVTAAHAQLERLDRLARIDALTGALNRAEFVRFLGETLGEQEQIILAINLHRFQTVNTTLGRNIGDHVLSALVKRLADEVPGAAGVGRLGGDVFAVAYPGREDVDAVTGKVIAATAAPFKVEGARVHVRIRVGVAVASVGADPSKAVEQAENALDTARTTAGPVTRRYDGTTAAAQERARQIERALSTAVANDELYIVYQPQVDLRTKSVVGVEALIRWKNPELGQVSPAELIPVAESSGFISELGRWVLRRACFEAARWPLSVPVAINVSPLQLQGEEIVEEVKEALYKSELCPQRLFLEVTESVFVSRRDSVMKVFDTLRLMGVRLALDDFGAGYSSLGYLPRMPIDKLKLDRMFMTGLEDGKPTRAIISSVVSMCQAMDIKLLCEGVETEKQMRELLDLGCEQAQGYHISRPMELIDLVEWLRTFQRESRMIHEVA